MAKSSRARQFEADGEHIIKDYDPEAEGRAADDASRSGDSEDENVGTEHYVDVGKSKLRKKEEAALGPEYRGSRVSRDALDDEDDEDDDEEEDDNEVYADPDNFDLDADAAAAKDSEIDSDEALGASDDEKLDGFVFRGSGKPKTKIGKRASAADWMATDEDSQEDGGVELDGEESDEDEDEDMDDGLGDLLGGSSRFDDDLSEEDGDDDMDEDEDDDEDIDEEEEDDDDEDEDEDGAKRSRVKGPGLGSTKVAPKPAPTAVVTEAEKGAAIAAQRKTYDGLLNLRIRLQKALIAANTFPELDSQTPSDADFDSAEEAALTLLNAVTSLRDDIYPTSIKRKRAEIEGDDMSNEDIWAQIESQEDHMKGHREELLEKWSRKTTSEDKRMADRQKQQRKNLTAALREQLADPERRLKSRTKVPRSCAPVQQGKKLAEDENIYDDADFYQLLLKELVDQRTVENDNAEAAAGAARTVMLNAAKEAKQRGDVDRKASKGRKMRFTVHEKLQNFMAPEDRRQWETGQIDRFFGTLLGQRAVLDEEEEEADNRSDVEDEVDVDVGGLRLFG